MQDPTPSCERAPTTVTNTARRGYAKHLWLAIVLLALACCPQVNSPADMIQDIENETVLIRDDKFVCAGVWVSPTLVITAGHCALAIGCPEDDDDDSDEDTDNEETEPCSPLGAKVPVRTRATDISQGVFLKYNKSYDLALIRVADPPRHPVAILSDIASKTGDIIHVVGHPMGIKWTYSRGVISGMREADEDTAPKLQISAPIHPGNSGGGVFNEKGQLLGLVAFNAGPLAGDLAFASLEGQIRDFLGHLP